MPRNVRTHLPNDTLTDPAYAPKHLTKMEFGKRLYSHMLSKGWRQSDLARSAGLPRDAISTYVRGKSLPTPQNLQKLADALDVKPEELLANHVESAIDADSPSFEMKVSPNAPEVAWIRINRLVRVTSALKIAEILQSDDAVDGV